MARSEKLAAVHTEAAWAAGQQVGLRCPAAAAGRSPRMALLATTLTQENERFRSLPMISGREMTRPYCEVGNGGKGMGQRHSESATGVAASRHGQSSKILSTVFTRCASQNNLCASGNFAIACGNLAIARDFRTRMGVLHAHHPPNQGALSTDRRPAPQPAATV